jgi:hypothetical protein
VLERNITQPRIIAKASQSPGLAVKLCVDVVRCVVRARDDRSGGGVSFALVAGVAFRRIDVVARAAREEDDPDQRQRGRGATDRVHPKRRSHPSLPPQCARSPPL